MPNEPLLQLDHVSAAYGALTVFHDVSFTLPAGHVLALMGASAVGKTTLLHVAAGLLQPAAGAVRRIGHAGFAFQVPSLLPWQTVRENALFGATLGRHRASAETALPDLFTRYSLTPYSAMFPHELSIGTQQRVAFVRALLARSRVLLLDEPFAACDVVLRRRLQEDLRGLVTRDALAAILVTHDFMEAVRVADRVCVLGGSHPATVVDDFVITLGEPDRFAADRAAAFAPYMSRLDRAFQDAATARGSG